jgi:predicted Zn-dependent protease
MVLAQRPAQSSVAAQLSIELRYAASFERRVILSDDPSIVMLVDRVGHTLARNSDAPIPVSFKVIDSLDPNVFVLSGGFIYVTTGLIATSGSEAEFASSLAYDIANYSAKVGRTVFMGDVITILPDPVIGVLPKIEIFPTISARASVEEQAAVKRADRLALHYLSNARYDASGYATLLQTLEARARPVKVDVPRHPKMKDRIRKVQEWIRTEVPPATDHVVTTTEFERVRHDLQ